MLMSIEELKEKNAKALEQLVAAHAIADALPCRPGQVFNALDTQREPFVTYEVSSLLEATVLIDSFPEKVPYTTASDGCFYIEPSERMAPARAERPGAKESDGCPYLSLQNYGHSDGTKAEFKFYTRALGKIVNVWVRLSKSPWHISLLASDLREHFGRGNTRRVVRKDYPRLDGAECVRLAFGDDGGAAYYFWYATGDYEAFVRNELSRLQQ